MPIQIIDLTDDQLPQILQSNNQAVPHVNALTLEELTALWRMSCYARLALKAGKPAGFLIAMAPDAEYQSPNFQWFKAHYPSFTYIDRVVVDPEFRGQGVGKVLYADIESVGETRAPILACEVNLEPANDASLLFHGSYGFGEVGQLLSGPADEKRVSLMIKPLPDYDYIQSRQ